MKSNEVGEYADEGDMDLASQILFVFLKKLTIEVGNFNFQG